MNKIVIPTALTLAVLVVPLAASASDCANAVPKDQWMSEADIGAKATKMGYEVRSVKAEGGCYEVYAIGKDSMKAELQFNPVTGEISSQKDED